MNIKVLTRKYIKEQISIERLFNFIFSEIIKNDIDIEIIENPHSNGLLNILKAIIFFRNRVDKGDLVHITGDIHFAAIFLKTGNIIITVHDLGLYRNLSLLRSLVFKTLWITLPFKKAKYIVAISEKTKQEILKIMPSISDKIIVIPNCITIDVNKITNLKRNKKPELLIVGTRENKNIGNSIKAIEGLDIHLNILGKLDKEHINLLNKCKVDYTNFVNVDEVSLLRLYQKVDILLFPSFYEGFGLPILEAQAQNVLVITSDISPMNSICGSAGMLVDPYSVDSIKHSLNNLLLLSDGEKLILLNKGKDNLIKYSAEHVSQQYFNLYKRILL